MKNSFIHTGLKLICLMGLSVNALAAELQASLGWADYQRYGFAVNGVVESSVIAQGSIVAKGQLLAKLDVRPFRYAQQQCQASVARLEPRIIDARQERDQAEELFERTVLSEVERQKITGRYDALLAEQKQLKANCQLQTWRRLRAELKARDAAQVIYTNIVSGMVISDENRHAHYLELVSTQRASATVWLSAQQKSQLESTYPLLRKAMDKVAMRVSVDGKSFTAKMQSLAIQPQQQGEHQGLYSLLLVFDYDNVVEPGKLVKVEY